MILEFYKIYQNKYKFVYTKLLDGSTTHIIYC